jgi:iron complex outermembrane recepter protein
MGCSYESGLARPSSEASSGRSGLRHKLWALSGVATLGMAFAAFSAPGALAAPASSDVSGQTAQSVTEIVVTAERREEKIQEVPITLTVVPQQQLDRQNITTTTDLVRAVPALTTSDEGVFQIRSIGTEGFGRSAEQSVSVVLDGVVLGRALTNAMYDLDHVEVLSGPQGTLFGKNATAGVVNIVTNSPVLGQYQAIGHVDAGDHDYVHSYVIGNLPLGDDAALRLSFHHDSNGHIVFNTLYDKWDYNTDDGVRARLLWRPTNDLTINLSGDYQKLASNGVNGVADFAGVAVYTYAPPGSALQQTLAACGIVASPLNNKVCGNSLYASGVNIGDTYGRWNGGGSLQIDYNLPRGLTFTSITALRETTNEDFGVHADIAGEFGDTLPQNILDRNLVPYFDRTWSEEARIASRASDPVNFVSGVYYSNTYTHDEIDQSGQLGVPLGPLEFRRLINMYIHQQNYAVFGQANWQATSQLKLFAGGRVTHDDLSDFSYNSFPGAFPAGNFIYTGDTGFFSVLPVNSCTLAGGVPYDTVQKPCPAGTSVNAPGKLSTTGLSGTVGAQYQFDRRLMLFATLSHGYKGPFLNESATYIATLPQTPLLVKPEYPTDVELGVKATINRFALDASLFYDYVQNFQTTIYVPPSNSMAVANFIQGNAPNAVTQGAEVSLFGDLSDNLSVNAGAIYNDAHFNNGFLVNCSAGPCPALRQLPFAPRFKATLSGDYHRLIAGPVVGFLQSDLAYSGSYPYASAPGFPGSPPRYLLGARAGVRQQDGRWSLAVFCRNCLDKRYPISAAPDGFATEDGGIVGTQISTYQFLTIDSYRVVGVTLDGRF